MSAFLVKIVRADGYDVILRPGGSGERDLIDDIVDRIMSKGVGFFRTEAHVKNDITEAVTEVLHELKSEIEPV